MWLYIGLTLNISRCSTMFEPKPELARNLQKQVDLKLYGNDCIIFSEKLSGCPITGNRTIMEGPPESGVACSTTGGRCIRFR